jgi:hypothetical protein
MTTLNPVSASWHVPTDAAGSCVTHSACLHLLTCTSSQHAPHTARRPQLHVVGPANSSPRVHQSVPLMMQPFKKVYRGPQADAATFATQQEFLDSLVPVPVESVDENSRTCAHCWRSYGESTPGEDDAEAPVRFRCNHVFGEQCMRSLFGIREPVRVDLTPLSFAPGSRGADLGKRLSAYVSPLKSFQCF